MLSFLANKTLQICDIIGYALWRKIIIAFFSSSSESLFPTLYYPTQENEPPYEEVLWPISEKDGIKILFPPAISLLSLSPQRFMFSALVCRQYLLCIWKIKTNWTCPQKARERTGLACHRQGCKKSWLTPQSCRTTPLAASEHDVPLQKPPRQRVSVSVTATVLRIKGISFSLRVNRFH